jgi:hypothetical protein
MTLADQPGYPEPPAIGYGRHTGHADLIRESVDGRVGEDPPGQPYPYRVSA